MIRRHIEDSVRRAMADTPVVPLNGARQTGKTTLAQAISLKGGSFKRISACDSGRHEWTGSRMVRERDALRGPWQVAEPVRALKINVGF
jgi:hypothetical protein